MGNLDDDDDNDEDTFKFDDVAPVAPNPTE